MARIRTFKPEFLRHEELQLLERNHSGKYPMFVFMGLWAVCDKQGVFPWKPLSLKLDIYPFLEYEMEETLNILYENGFIQKFTAADNNTYGFVINFEKHQRINGIEAKNPAKYPKPDLEAIEKQQRSNKEVIEKQSIDRERERERERERILSAQPAPQDSPTACAVAQKGLIPVLPEQTKTAPVSQPPPKKRGITLTDDQKPLFHTAKACFETDEKTKALMYQDRGSTQMYMENLKLFVVRCHNIAPGITADFMKTVLDHFRVLCGGRLKAKNVEFNPRALITPWIWEIVIGSLPKADDELTEKIRASIKGMFK